MSQDFTPKITYEMQKYIKKEYHFDLKETMDLIYESKDSKTYKTYTQRFPNLSFLFSKFSELPNLNNEQNLKILDELETELTEHLNDKICSNQNSIIQLWYFGLLDKNFYYNTQNDRLLYEWIISKFKEVQK